MGEREGGSNRDEGESKRNRGKMKERKVMKTSKPIDLILIDRQTEALMETSKHLY